MENCAHTILSKYYFNDILDFCFNYDNLTYYGDYGYQIKKPTRFKSNINLNLRKDNIKKDLEWGKFSKDYNIRSNIPLNLIKDIFKATEKHLKQLKKRKD